MSRAPESADSASRRNGARSAGSKGQVVAIRAAAYALKPGEISQPVLTQFGYQ